MTKKFENLPDVIKDLMLEFALSCKQCEGKGTYTYRHIYWDYFSRGEAQKETICHCCKGTGNEPELVKINGEEALYYIPKDDSFQEALKILEEQGIKSTGRPAEDYIEKA